MITQKTEQDWMSEVINLILNPSISETERTYLVKAEQAIETKRPLEQVLAELKVDLGSLGLTFELTREAQAFYQKLLQAFLVKNKSLRPGGILF